MEASSQNKISHYAKPSRSLSMKIRNRSTALYDVYCETQGLQAKANICEMAPSTLGNGVCVKCDNQICVTNDLIDKKFEEVQIDDEDKISNLIAPDGAEILGIKNNESTKLHGEIFQINQTASAAEKVDRAVSSAVSSCLNFTGSLDPLTL